MPSERMNKKIPRRKMLSIVVGSTCYAVHAGTLKAGSPTAAHVHQTLKAADVASQPVRSTVFNNHHLKTIAALSENIIPTDSHSPGAKAARVDEFVNETVSASGQTIQKLWVDGLAAVDKLAEREFGKSFADCSADQQTKILTRISQNEERPVTLEERFFVALKQATVDGYYLSDVGIHQELQYQGNAVLAEFPGCTHEEHKTGHKARR
jgi:gluconate 2-dehydrogenase subunit 3-like protein